MSDGKETKEPMGEYVSRRIDRLLKDCENKGFPEDSLGFLRDQLRVFGRAVLSEHESDLQTLRSELRRRRD